MRDQQGRVLNVSARASGGVRTFDAASQECEKRRRPLCDAAAAFPLSTLQQSEAARKQKDSRAAPCFARMANYASSLLFALRLLHTFAATPARPVPSRMIVAGSGTAVAVMLSTPNCPWRRTG